MSVVARICHTNFKERTDQGIGVLIDERFAVAISGDDDGAPDDFSRIDLGESDLDEAGA